MRRYRRNLAGRNLLHRPDVGGGIFSDGSVLLSIHPVENLHVFMYSSGLERREIA